MDFESMTTNAQYYAKGLTMDFDSLDPGTPDTFDFWLVWKWV